MSQLRQLNLQFAFLGPGALGENIENQGSPVEHLAIEDQFQVAALGGRKLIIENNRIDVLLPAFARELVGFAGANERSSHWRIEFLDAIPDDLTSRGRGQFMEFGEGILEVPGGA
jgi:hypothetical protein